MRGRDRRSGPCAQRAATEGEPDWFVDRAQATGLDFVHFNGMSGSFYHPEIMAPGVALFDYDNDGDLDVYLVQGQMLGTGKTVSQALLPPREPLPLDGRLYRNDLAVDADGTRTLRFTDVTERSGIDARGYGMGVAAGDFDNDGWVDLYLTNFGPNQLFRNNCDGTFTDVSRTSGTDDARWSVLGVVRRLRPRRLARPVRRQLPRLTASTAHQLLRRVEAARLLPAERIAPQPDRLYRNRGNGTFADVTASAGVARAFGPALGVATADFNGDGWIDLFVANDLQDNQLWINQRDGTFKDTALLSGAALDCRRARVKRNMGVDAGDFDNDGDEDLFITEFTGRGARSTSTTAPGCSRNRARARAPARDASPTPASAHGWFDYDNDGWLDILAVNGLVTQNLDALGPDNPFPLQQRNQLFRNLGHGTVRGRDRSRRGGVRAVGSRSRRRVRRHRQRRRRGRGRGERCWPGPPADEPGRQPEALAGAAAGRGRRRARHARRARGDPPVRWPDAVAPGAGGRQLRVRERSARARWPRRSTAAPRGSGDLAERARGGVDRRAGRSLHDVEEGTGRER